MGPFIAVVAVSLGAGAGQQLSAEAAGRYQGANEAISAAQWGRAIETLNALAAEYPRVAEVFAARCSALVGAKNFAAAEADCEYSLSVKPSLAAARYALAIAQEHQRKREQAVANYRLYAALDEKQAPYRAQASARADALQSERMPAPPLVSATAVVAAAGPSLVVYKNHLSSFGRVMLVLDGKLIGDLSMDEYVEVEAAPGEHLLEARTYPKSAYENPRTWSRPVQLGQGTVYVNFQNRGPEMVLTEVPAGQARSELRSDCKLAYTRRIGAESVNAPAVAGGVGVVWPGGGVVVAPGVVVGGRVRVQPGAAPRGGGGDFCQSSIDCPGAGAFCKDRGDGLKVCMNDGARGDFCSSSVDCGGGLFCKDRGDGLNVCM